MAEVGYVKWPFDGGCGDKGYEKLSRLLGYDDNYDYECDPKTGRKTGDLRCMPTVALLECDQAYPELMKAMRKSTALAVEVWFSGKDDGGNKIITNKDLFEGVIICGLRRCMPNTQDPANRECSMQMEVKWLAKKVTAKAEKYKTPTGIEQAAVEDAFDAADPTA